MRCETVGQRSRSATVRVEAFSNDTACLLRSLPTRCDAARCLAHAWSRVRERACARRKDAMEQVGCYCDRRHRRFWEREFAINWNCSAGEIMSSFTDESVLQQSQEIGTNSHRIHQRSQLPTCLPNGQTPRHGFSSPSGKLFRRPGPRRTIIA